MMRTILILGCGYVGGAFARAMRGEGHRVLGVTRNAATAQELAKAGIECYVGSVQESGWHAFAGSPVDWVLNCVGASGGGLEGYRLSYLEGNRSLGKWMRATAFAGKAIYTSSVSVYPDRGGDWVDESLEEADTDRGRLLLESEELFFQGAGETDRKTVLRLGGIYGPGRSFLASRIRESKGRFPGVGGYYLNLIRLEDILSGLRALFEDDGQWGGVYNLVDDEPMLKSDLVAGLAASMDALIPQFDGALSAGASLHRREEGAPANRRVSNRKLKAAIAWSPRYPNALEGMKALLSS